ncbi:cupin domain-containing protein [Patescibacteria group bacterium]|nr:cupin domain-containing protein [Patescibacteria group bacterium]
MEESQENAHSAKIKLKPWGREIWFAQTEDYAGKILEVKEGHRLSMQYHEEKEETQHVFSGKIEMTYGKDKFNLKTVILVPGDTFHIAPYTIHRVKALENSKIFEVSTPHLNDIVKLSDDYGRVGKGNNEDLDTKLHTHDVEFNVARTKAENKDKNRKEAKISNHLNYKK